MIVALKPPGVTTIRSKEMSSTGGTFDLKKRSGSPKANTASSATKAKQGRMTHNSGTPPRVRRERNVFESVFASMREEICSVILYRLEHAHPAKLREFALMRMKHVVARILQRKLQDSPFALAQHHCVGVVVMIQARA